MGYVRSNPHGYRDDQLEGIFGAIGGALKSAGGFVARRVAPAALSFVPVVGGPASRAYSGLVNRAPTRTPLRAPARAPARAPIGSALTFTQRITAAARAAAQAAAEDRRVQDWAVENTARYASPRLLAAAAARQARDAPTALKASTILPALAVAALVLRKR